MRRIAIALCAFLALAFVPALPSKAADSNQDLLNKYLWPPASSTVGDPLSLPLLGYHFGIVDNFVQGSGGQSRSRVEVVTNSSQGYPCESFMDVKCQNLVSGGATWAGNLVLPPCSSDDEKAFCIESVKISDTRGTRNLKLKRIVSGQQWPADAEHGFLAGSEPSLWSDPLNPSDLEGYKVTVGGNLGFLDSSARKANPVPFKLSMGDFISNITAYSELHDSNFKGYKSFKSADGSFLSSSSYTPGCIWVDDGACGATKEFPAQSKYVLTVHLPPGLSSWLIGRMSDPSIQITNLPGLALNGSPIQRVSVEASPVLVPLIGQDIPIEKISTSTQNVIFNPKDGLCTNKPYCEHGFVGGNTSSSFPFAFRMYDIFKDLLDQKANMMMPIWSVNSLMYFSPEAAAVGAGCRGAEFDGVVSSNASIYEGNPPSWDGSSLNYNVAGVHLDSSGNVFQGSYDLLLSSQYARCLYKFSNAPISATISVSDSAGTQSVTTSSFSESNGWVHMAARGFTFSSPTIKISLQQEKKTPAAPTPMASVAPTPTVQPVTQAAKKITITCIKNKTTKLVTGVKPVCPAGYKKK
jgi:hypothetical protein